MIQDAISALTSRDFNEYIKLAREVLETPTEEAFWQELAAQHPESINFIDVLLAWPKNKLFTSTSVLVPVLSRLKTLAFDDYKKLLEFFAGNDEANFLAAVLAEVVAKSPALPLEFAAALTTPPQESSKVLFVWAQSFVSGAPSEAAEYLLSNFQSNGRLVMPARLVLLSYDEDFLANHAGLSKIATQIADSVLLPDERGEDSWRVVVKLVQTSGHASDVLMSAVAAQNLEAVGALGGALSRLKVPEFGARKLPLADVIVQFVKGGAADKKACNYADHVVAMLLHREKTHRVALDFLISLGAQKRNAVDAFQAAFNSLFGTQDEFAQVLTKWLLVPRANTDAIASLLSMYGGHESNVRLDEALVLAADKRSVFRAARRILALSFNGNTMCLFAAELLRIDGLGEFGLQVGEGMLVDIYSEYPGGTRRFVSERLKTVDKKTPSGKVYKHVYAKILKWQALLAKLPKVPELSPTDRERYAVFQADTRWQREIQIDAESKSFFMSMYPSKNVIIQGGRFASHEETRAPIIAPMGSIEHSIELPISERADPMGGLMRRLDLLEEQ